MKKSLIVIFLILPFTCIKAENFYPDFSKTNEVLIHKIEGKNYSSFNSEFDFQIEKKNNPDSSISFVLGQEGKLEKYYLMAKFGGDKGELRIVKKNVLEKIILSRAFTFEKNQIYRFKIYYLGYKGFLKITNPEKDEVLWDLGAILPLNFNFNQAQLRIFGEGLKIITPVKYNFQLGDFLPKKGGYLKSPKYNQEPPKFEDMLEVLPQIQGDVSNSMYEFSWETMIKNIKKVNPSNKIFISTYIDEAFSPAVFQWDTIFMLFFAKYLYPKFNAINSLDNFYATQTREGKILRVLLEKWGLPEKGTFFNYGVNPPLFSWAEVEWAEYTGDFSRYSKVFPVLEQYASWLEISRKAQNTEAQLYWNTGLGSGMDNIPIASSENHAWIDMSAQMVLMYKNLAKIANYLNFSEKEKYFTKMAEEIGNKINKYMWNEEKGMYFCLDEKGNQIDVWQIGAFWPLLAGITSNEQNKKLVKNLKDPKLFWTDFPFPALAKNHPEFNSRGGYWKGGVWAPTNYMIILALNKIGEQKFAFEVSQKMVKLVLEVFKKTKTIWEAYAPEFENGKPRFSTGTKEDLVRQNFIGWSGLYPTTIFLEEVLGVKFQRQKKEVTWRIFLEENYELKNLNILGGKLDLSRKRNTILINGKNISPGWKINLLIPNLPKMLVLDIENGEKEIIIN